MSPEAKSVKRLGIIGGIGPESTIEYYRLLVARYRAKSNDRHYPLILLNSIDMKRMRDFFEAGQWAEVTEYLLAAIHLLARAGADFGLMAANTPHNVFRELEPRSPIPLISIVAATRRAAQGLGLRKVGLFGTRFTMQARFYSEDLERAGISLVLPEPKDRDYIHQKYMDELVEGVFLPETRAQLLRIVDKLRRQAGIEGLILGGTELSLILTEPNYQGLPLLDTTKIHVEEAVAQMLQP
jgi:aspartate racemase